MQIAKEQLAAGRKDLALLALRKKKYQEGLLEKTNQQLMNLEQLVRDQEFFILFRRAKLNLPWWSSKYLPVSNRAMPS